MTDGRGGPVPQQPAGRGRWTSFVADPPEPGRKSRTLHEEGDPRRRVRVEHDGKTLLVHVSDEEGHGWTTLALDRSTQAWAVAQRDSQLEAASSAYRSLYGMPGGGGSH